MHGTVRGTVRPALKVACLGFALLSVSAVGYLLLSSSSKTATQNLKLARRLE